MSLIFGLSHDLRGNRSGGMSWTMELKARVLSREPLLKNGLTIHSGDGLTDDTEAINRAISDGNRCGPDCRSSTRYPAVVWFPAGNYLVSSPIIQYHNTQLLGDVRYPQLGASEAHIFRYLL